MVVWLDNSKDLLKVERSVALKVYSTVDWMDDSRVDGWAALLDEQMAEM